MTPQKTKTYVPPPTLRKLHSSLAYINGIFGPVGSGKSSGCMMHMHYSDLIMPHCIDDGVRRARWILVRNTQSMLKTTTLRTWLEWLPEDSESGHLVKSYPMHYDMNFIDQHGVKCEFEYFFLALDKIKDVRNLLSLEVTGIYFNELREIPKAIFDAALTRPRWPNAARLGLKEGDRVPYQILADSNKPNERHWINDYFFKGVNARCDVATFDQPPAMLEISDGEFVPNPEAENIGSYDGYGYYTRMMNSMSKESFRVYGCNQFGAVNGGSLVFKGYNSSLHHSKEFLLPVAGKPVVIGFDFGSTPACAFVQYIGGQIRVLEEIISLEQINIDDFVRAFVLPILQQEEYRSCNVITVCDPSGIAGKSYGENYSILRLNSFGLNAIPAYTNKLDTRLQTIHTCLSTLNQGTASFMVSARCAFIHEAFVSGYRYKQVRKADSHDAVDTEDPDKNEYSHVMDALQYAVMHFVKPITSSKPPMPQTMMVNGKPIRI